MRNNSLKTFFRYLAVAAIGITAGYLRCMNDVAAGKVDVNDDEVKADFFGKDMIFTVAKKK